MRFLLKLFFFNLARRLWVRKRAGLAIILLIFVIPVAIWMIGRKLPMPTFRGGYGFIGINSGQDINHDNLESKLRNFIDRAISENGASVVSVYYENLPGKEEFVINGQEKFFPASMLKLPMMLAYFKEAEVNLGILEKQIIFNLELPKTNYYFKPEKEIEKGKSYGVYELLNAMITKSDNNAGNLLHVFLGKEKAEMVFRDLNLPVPSPKDFLTVKDYSVFYRVLFEGSYIDKEFSENALHILKNTDFKNGLAAGIADDLPIAHKFGELRGSNGQLNQLHDCGIVYYPEKPYLICVMTKGSDFEKLAEVIQGISLIAYRQMNN